MKKVKFLRIYLEGFRSFVNPTEFDLERPGLNMLKGSNGAGKTTIIEGIIWTLYRTNLKETTDDKVVSWEETRPATFKGTKVGVDFLVNDEEYSVVRHKNYKGDTEGLKGNDRLMIFENGVLKGEETDKKEQQEFINKLLGMDSRVFLNSILFGQRMAKLISAQNDEKRKLFEEMFDLYWVEGLKTKARVDLQEIEEDLKKFETELLVRENTVDSLKETLAANSKILKEFEENKKNKVDGYKVQQQEYIKERKKLEGILEDIQRDIGLIDFNQEEYEALEARKQKLREKYYTQKAVVDVIDQKAETALDAYNILEGKEHKLEKELKEVQDELQKHYKSIERELDEILKLIGENEAHIQNSDTLSMLDDKDFSEENEELQEKLSEHKDLLKTLDKEIDTDKSEYARTEKVLKDLELSLENRSDTCDRCNRPHDKKSEQFVYGKDLEQVKIYKDRLKELKVDIRRADEEIKSVYQQLEDIEAEIKDIQEAHDNYKTVEEATKEIKLLERDKEHLQSKDAVLKEKVSSLQKHLKQVSTEVDQADKACERLEKDRAEAHKALKVIENEGKKVSEGLLEYYDLKTQLNELKSAQDNAQDSVQDNEKTIKNIQDRIDEAEQEKPPKVNLQETKDKILETEKIQRDTLDRCNELERKKEVISWWITKGFGASGLRAFVFAAMLTELNKKVIPYANRLGVSLKFSVDLTKASRPFNTICSIAHGVDKDYNEFSGGQKARLDIALMFGMHDLISSSSTDINILLLDEVFEGLDEEGEGVVFDLIRLKAENKSVYVISHSAVLDNLYSNTIEFTLNEKGQTEISV